MGHRVSATKPRRSIGALQRSRWVLAALALATTVGCAANPQSLSTHFQDPHNIPLVPTFIGESGPHHFLLDTGVYPSVIDLETGRSLGLPIDDSDVQEAEGTGEGEGLAIMPARIIGLSIEGRSFPEIEAVAADLSSFSEVLGVELAGILGFSFLDARVVRIDYAAKQIWVADRAEELPPLPSSVQQTYTIPLLFNSDGDQIPVFEIEIDGEPVMVSLDTGKSGGIEFFKSAVERLQLEEAAAQGAERTRLGARGTSTVTTGTMDSVTLGPFNLTDVPVAFSERLVGEERREGNAGNNFLNNFVVTIDYVDRLIIFAR